MVYSGNCKQDTANKKQGRDLPVSRPTGKVATVNKLPATLKIK